MGGGILEEEVGQLTLENSVVAGNRSIASAPNGRFAEGGGIFVAGGALTIRGGAVAHNLAALDSALPNDVGQRANAAGIHLSDQASATIAGARIDGNRLRMTNSVGDAIAFSAGLHADGPLVLRDSSVSGNAVTATTTAPSPASAFAESGAAELNADATISGTQLEHNSVTATAPAAPPTRPQVPASPRRSARMTIIDSLIRGNRLTAATTTGSSTVHGGGLANIGVLTLRNTSVSDNGERRAGPPAPPQAAASGTARPQTARL